MSTIEITILVAVGLLFLISPALVGKWEEHRGLVQRDAELVNLLKKETESC